VENDTNVDEPLIQNCPDCGASMDVTDVEPLSAVICPTCGAPTTVSSMIDHFQLVDVLGHGGMGAVYKAHDTSLDRMVALKLLRKSSGSTEQIKQLETEAAITASINHPHVVRVFSTGMDRGRFYIAMELVEKGTLDKLIEIQGRVAEAQVLEVGIQIASGLRAAQQAGLIHRDVKPGNILFAEAHTAKIVDFGLAIFAEDEAKVRGEIWGTPYYVAPEKLDNKPEDFRSDIYSLGGTLFHALAGRPPFEAENASLVAYKHLKNQAVSLQAFAPHVSSNTNYVINRTLNKDPDQRYQSYDELIEHLEYASNELAAGRGKASEKRVVLETEESKKAQGYLTFAMIGVLVLLVIGGFVFKDKVFGGKGEESKKGSAMLASSVDNLASNKPDQAVTTLKTVTENKPAQPWLNWSDMLLGLAQSASGHQSEAVDTFQRIQSRGAYSSEPLAKFFVDVSKQMTNEHPIDSKINAGETGYEPVALLFYAMKDWGIGDEDDAAALFGRFRRADFTGSDAWIEGLKPMATNFIEEYQSFQMASERWKAAKTLDQKRAAQKALEGVTGKFAARAQQLAAQAATDVKKAEQDRNKLLAQGKIVDGKYKLTNRKTGKVLEVENHSHDEFHKLSASKWSNAGHQQWNVTAVGSTGYYQLVCQDGGKALNVPGGQTGDGTVLQQANFNKNSPSERWKIEKVPDSKDGSFYTLTSLASGKVIAVKGDTDGSPIIQTDNTNAPEQQWKIEGL
jgi:serine/threonine protein kinase